MLQQDHPNMKILVNKLYPYTQVFQTAFWYSLLNMSRQPNIMRLKESLYYESQMLKETNKKKGGLVEKQRIWRKKKNHDKNKSDH